MGPTLNFCVVKHLKDTKCNHSQGDSFLNLLTPLSVLTNQYIMSLSIEVIRPDVILRDSVLKVFYEEGLNKPLT